MYRNMPVSRGTIYVIELDRHGDRKSARFAAFEQEAKILDQPPLPLAEARERLRGL